MDWIPYRATYQPLYPHPTRAYRLDRYGDGVVADTVAADTSTIREESGAKGPGTVGVLGTVAMSVAAGVLTQIVLDIWREWRRGGRR